MNQPIRRSMSAALQTVDLPPEAVALIRAGTPQPLMAHPVLAGASAPAPIAASSAESEGVSENAGERIVADKTPRRSAKPRALPEREAEPEPAGSGAALTVRLPGNLPQQLLRASMTRKLCRQRPYTQREIVAQAIRDWLKRNAGEEEELA